MSSSDLKNLIKPLLWKVVDSHDTILSATLTGSFLLENEMDGISDIDLILIVERLNSSCYGRLIHHFDHALRTPLKKHGFDLIINPTLGPLKFNDDRTAVLHLMM